MESSKKEMRIRIGGMTCVNCQNKIENALSAMEGVVSAKISYSDGTANIILAENGSEPEEIYAVIEKLGYKVLSEREQGQDVIKAVCLLVIIVALYIMLQSTGVLNLLAPGRLADTEAGYGMLFVIGLITSVHCISMCGGINLSQCLSKAEGGERGGKFAAFRPALAYNFGRVLSYTAVGFVLGTVGALIGGGAEVGLSAILQGLLKIAAGILMVIMGINEKLERTERKMLSQRCGFCFECHSVFYMDYDDLDEYGELKKKPGKPMMCTDIATDH